MPIKNAFLALLATILSGGLLTACQSSPEEQEDYARFVRGTIVRVDAFNRYTMVTLGDIAEPYASNVGAEELALYVYPDTPIFVKEPGGSVIPGSLDDLRVGTAIEARYGPDVTRSIPPESPAWEIVVDQTQ